MASTTYAGTQYQLRAAQRTLDAHVTCSATGRCARCGSAGPCDEQEAAAALFARFLALPQRRPGASKPELLGARQITGPTTSVWAAARGTDGSLGGRAGTTTQWVTGEEQKR